MAKTTKAKDAADDMEKDISGAKSSAKDGSISAVKKIAIEAYDPIKHEPEILDFWNSKKIYEKAKELGKGKKKFYYLDGPPYTSGRIHIGHAWGKALRDSIMRYKRMAGFDVWDRAGFDMHGLPMEHAVEKKFGIKHKEEIADFGILRYVQECEKLSVDNMNSMIADFKRLGVWMGFEDPYMSIKNEYIEGVWWLVKKAYENNRMYEGLRTMPWCPECASANAKHELEYENVEEESIFVKFKVNATKNEYLIIWTTTPWTIPFNLAVMVNPELDYVKAKVQGEKGEEIWVIAKALANIFISNIGKKFTIMEEFKGEDLEGLKYDHPFAKYVKQYGEIEKKTKNLHTVILSDKYVDTSAGSGLVHCAPGCGPEDYEVGYKYGLPAFNILTEQGEFDSSIEKFKGLRAKKDDAKFIKFLEDEGALITTAPVEHEYPHCWRCHNPVVFRATKQWFFKIEDLKENMKELNKDVNWVPDWAGSRQFNSWLDNLRDNSITKQRFWGTPFPVWKCENDACKELVVIGSVDELKKHTKEIPKNLHKPWIDDIKFKCDKCGKMMHRLPDVLDVWIDAGSASWLCLDYPKDDKLFNKLYPADFILEGKDQIRGWFNLLFVNSMISMDNCPFKAVYMHGFINDSQGRKMSKSLGNVISPYEVFDKFGADTLRYYMIGGANPGVDINYNFEDMKMKNRNLVVIWNLHKFIVDLANELGVNPSKLKVNDFGKEENYILSKLNSAIRKVTELFDSYNLNQTPWEVESIFMDLSRTYIQLVRDKSSVGSMEERHVVLYTAYHTFMEALKLFAPIAPFISEMMYQNFKEAFGLKHESIHLYGWPECDAKMIDKRIETNFEYAYTIIQAISNAREKAQLGIRWPLKQAIIVTENKEVENAVAELKETIMRQMNVKDIIVSKSFNKVEEKVKPDFKKIAPQFKELSTMIIAKLAMESTGTILSHINREGKYEFEINKQKVAITKDHLIYEKALPSDIKEGDFKYGNVYIDTFRTEELEAEGYAREMMRRVQQLRKTAGLEKLDRITLFIKVNDDLREMIDSWQDSIKEKVGASVLKLSSMSPNKAHAHSDKFKVKNQEIEIFFDVA